MLKTITEITLLESLLERYEGDVPRAEIIRMIVERQTDIAIQEMAYECQSQQGDPEGGKL